MSIVVRETDMWHHNFTERILINNQENIILCYESVEWILYMERGLHCYSCFYNDIYRCKDFFIFILWVWLFSLHMFVHHVNAMPEEARR